MRYPFWPFLGVVIVPLLVGLPLEMYWMEKHRLAASTFFRVEVFEERAEKIDAGEVTLSREQVADLYRTMARTDLVSAEGFRLMAKGHLFSVIQMLGFALLQVGVLFAVYRKVTKNDDG